MKFFARIQEIWHKVIVNKFGIEEAGCFWKKRKKLVGTTEVFHQIAKN